MTDTTHGNLTSLTTTQDVVPTTIASKTPTTQSTEALKDLAFGSLAGLAGKIIEYPFDTLKVRLQSQPSPPIYHGPLDCLQQSLRQDGLRGLYRGISAPLFGAAIETSSLFFSYRIAQDVLSATWYKGSADKRKGENLPLSALTACGAISGAFTSLLLTPIELVKCQMQVPPSASSPLQPKTPFSIIVSTFRRHGLLGFWHGQLGTLIRETGGSAAWFGSYEGVGALFRSWNMKRAPPTIHSSGTRASEAPLPIYQQLLAGATAGVSYNFVFFPADTIKSRMQTEEVVKANTTIGQSVIKRQTFWISGRELWREQGLRGMYRGCGITVARAAPSSAFIFAVYEGLRGWWG